MRGRYGMDQFGRFLNIVVLILLVVSMFTRIGICYYIALAVMIYFYFRLFSRNIPKRYAENQWFLRMTGRQGGGNAARGTRSYDPYKRTHKVFLCPSCKQKIRVPREKGKIEIRCPKCSEKFIRRT